MPNSPNPEARLVALFALGLLLFNYPLLAIFNNGRMLAGVPLGFLYIFGAWAGLILLIARTVNRRG
jgi:hypothetical protein